MSEALRKVVYIPFLLNNEEERNVHQCTPFATVSQLCQKPILPRGVVPLGGGKLDTYLRTCRVDVPWVTMLNCIKT